jgi:predicted ATPase
MELVYLWVGKYKNIKEQGFNFFPKFDCNYDKDSNELIIDEKKDYLSIFPDNINVTAIVGENGSGKSSIAELLGEFNWKEFHKSNKSFLLFFHKRKFIFRYNSTNSDLYFTIKNNTQYKNNTTSRQRELFISYFANELSTFLNKNLSIGFKSYEKFDAMNENSKQNMMRNNKLTNMDVHKINEYELFNKRFEKILSKEPNLFSNLNEQFIFDKKKREIHFYEMGAIIVGSQEPLNRLFNVSKHNDYQLFDDSSNDNQSFFYKYLIINKLLFINDFKDINLDEMIGDITEIYQKDIFNENDYSEIMSKIENRIPIGNYTLNNVKDILNNFDYKEGNIWIEKESTNIIDIYKYNNPLLNDLNKTGNFRTNYFHNGNEEYNYLSLSSGEREYLKLLTHIVYHLQDEERRNIFFLDEPDSTLHPNWQKRLINDLVYFVKKYNERKTIQLIITSHSPFILSDLPKENVIFLKNGKQEKPFKDNEQTFGANIHTLLSHGFFMEDGLMGEFAKSKITDIVELLKKPQLSEDEIKNCKYIISIIGEPLLQKTLEHQLNEKLNPNETELQKLEREQEEIQKRIDKLTGKNNETN